VLIDPVEGMCKGMRGPWWVVVDYAEMYDATCAIYVIECLSVCVSVSVYV
jgi:hypothetical protein